MRNHYNRLISNGSASVKINNWRICQIFLILSDFKRQKFSCNEVTFYSHNECLLYSIRHILVEKCYRKMENHNNRLIYNVIANLLRYFPLLVIAKYFLSKSGLMCVIQAPVKSKQAFVMLVIAKIHSI